MAVQCRGLVGISLVASLMWSGEASPCSGPFCVPNNGLSTIDGGVPVNFQPLVLTGPRDGFPQGGAQVRRADGGLVPTQLQFGYGTLFLVTPPLVEGERYLLERRAGCTGQVGWWHTVQVDAGLWVVSDAGVTESFTVTSAVGAATARWVSVEVADAGTSNRWSEPCGYVLRYSFVDLRFAVLPEGIPLLPFFAWDLDLAPTDGGPLVRWASEPVGGLLGDGGISEKWEAYGPDADAGRYRGRSIATVLRACQLADGGDSPYRETAPVGRYRARLRARLLDSNAGFVTSSSEFEVLPCLATGPSPPVVGADGGASPGTSPSDGGAAAGPSLPVSASGCGCAGSGSSASALTLALIALRLRRTRPRA